MDTDNRSLKDRLRGATIAERYAVVEDAYNYRPAAKLRSIYIMGSLRNPGVPALANAIDALGIEAFDGWFSPGPETDDRWRDHEKQRGRSYGEALAAPHAVNVFEFDKRHIDRCDAAVLYMPAGKSAHLELGYALGKGKPGFILFDEEPERWDVMYQFATGIYFKVESFLADLKEGMWTTR